jgi:hypothetical protein
MKCKESTRLALFYYMNIYIKLKGYNEKYISREHEKVQYKEFKRE